MEAIPIKTTTLSNFCDLALVEISPQPVEYGCHVLLVDTYPENVTLDRRHVLIGVSITEKRYYDYKRKLLFFFLSFFFFETGYSV